jgi:hypothetical protein
VRDEFLAVDAVGRSLILRVLPASAPIDAAHNNVPAGIAPIACGSSYKV